MAFDITKPFQCRNGSQAGATKGPDGRLYGWLKAGETVSSLSWDANGRVATDGSEFPYDLINVPLRRILDVWVNIFEQGPATLIPDRQEADRERIWLKNMGPRIACLHIVREFKEGDGL